MKCKTLRAYEELAYKRMTAEDISEYLWEEGEKEHYWKLYEEETNL